MKRNFTCFLFAVLTCFLAGFSVDAFAANTVLKEKQLRKAVREFILEKTGDCGMEIKITRISLNGDIVVPQGKIDYEIVAPRRWQGWGRTVLGLLVRVDDRLVKNMSVPVEVEALTDMVVALRPLPRGKVVEGDDVALMKRDMATAVGKVCFSLSDVLGKRVRVPVRGNTPLRNDYLEKVPLVKIGQIVTIVAENGDLRVTALGKARGSGAEGDLIMVQNMVSKKSVQGRVVDAGTVLVNF